MRKFKLSTEAYKRKLEQTFGYADEEMVKRYAVQRQRHKAARIAAKSGADADFNPFTDDPNCKTCGKKKN